jgi:hypothetical protein
VTDLPEVMGVPAAELEAWRPSNPAHYRPDTRLVYTGPLFAQLDLPIPPQVQASTVANPRPTSCCRPVRRTCCARSLHACVDRPEGDASRHGARFRPGLDPGVVVAGRCPATV